MKHLWLVPGAALLLVLLSCKKKECCDIPAIPDFFLAKKNGAEWQGSPSGSILPGDTIVISGKYKTNNREELIEFKIRFDGLGYYPLKANENYYKITQAGVAVALYKPDPAHLNNVSIASYNNTEEIIQGFFELRFVKISGDANNLYPDKIIMDEGKFKTALNH